MREMRAVRVGAALAMAAVLLAGCSGSSGGSEPDDSPKTTTTAADGPATTAATPTTAGPSTTSAKPTTPTSTEPSNGLEPGDACSMEEGSPDCIDPDGDGEGTYLIGGADCIATAPDPAICTDLDGDGLAGYPDSN